ncbi:hypothetical protein D9M68_954380 [compost metagenome]
MGMAEVDAIDADTVAIQLVAGRRNRAVLHQRLVPPGHFIVELVVHSAAQAGIEEQGGGVVLDQYGHVVHDHLLGPVAIGQGEGVQGLGLGGLHQGETQALGLGGKAAGSEQEQQK